MDSSENKILYEVDLTDKWKKSFLFKIFEIIRCRNLKYSAKNFSPNRILDYGCNTGRLSRKIHSLYPGSEIVGYDNSSDYIKIARSYNDKNIYFSNELTAFSEKYDLIYVYNVFEYVYDFNEIITKIKLASKKGTILSICYNNTSNLYFKNKKLRSLLSGRKVSEITNNEKFSNKNYSDIDLLLKEIGYKFISSKFDFLKINEFIVYEYFS